MTNLPKVQEHLQLIQAVNARELHAFLQVQTTFKDWIARRISEYGFLEGVDFCSILSESTGGRPAKEYAITLDMAKELSMVERNEQGKQARKYFIECERQLQQPKALTRLEILQIALDAEKENLALKDQLAQAQPKIAHYDFVVTKEGLINASQVGGKIGLSAVALNRHLDGFGVYNKAIKRNKRTFNHWFVEQGLGVMRQTDTGHEQGLFTHKGEAWIVARLANEGVIA